MIDAFDVLDDAVRDLIRPHSMPSGARPMLATLTDDRFSRRDWIYERKLDGVRCLVHRDKRGVRIVSRNGNRLDDAVPELGDTVAEACDLPIVFDGEIVAFRGPVSSFAELQQRIGITDPDEGRASGVRVFLYAFDLLHLDGFDTTQVPLRARKKLLRATLRWDDPLRFTQHRNREGEVYFRQACAKGWEGILAKQAESTYRMGTRSKQWLKFKCAHGQELVIGGFTDPKGERVGFGALLVGYHEGGALRYAGRVGTGFDDELLERLHAKLRRVERSSCPFDPEPDEGSTDRVHWVRPELVGEVGFTEWTDDGRLRHPRFLGLRPDKDPPDVVRERPEGSPVDG